MPHTTYSKQTYGWGDLRVLRKGHSYTCIIHPEHLAAIYRQEAFTDEQGYRWVPEIKDGTLTLTCDSHHFCIPLEQLNA